LEVIVKIESFKDEFKDAFARLNYDWINKFFEVEDMDRKILDNPRKYILDPGGHILFATIDGLPVGTVALKQLGYEELEITKMAVDTDYHGKGIGKALMEAAINYAKKMGVQRLYLESHTKLGPALGLYRKSGFKEITGRTSPYARSNIHMALELADLPPYQN